MALHNVIQRSSGEKFAGFTDEQVRSLLSHIATDAHTMANICRMQVELAGLDDTANIFSSLASMANVIGAMADAPTGGHVGGAFEDWILGPLFNAKAVEANH